MKRSHRHRPLVYEQLESKAAPSSMLMVVLEERHDVSLDAIASGAIATDSSTASDYRYETDHILRFVAENTTGGDQRHRAAPLPTAAQCAVADEMMKLAPAAWNSLVVIGFCDDGTEL